MTDEITDRPEWDKSIAGTHPAFFTPLTQEETTQAMNLRRFLPPKDLWVADNKEAVRSNGILLQAAIDSELPQDVVNGYRAALATAFANLGEFEQARLTITRKFKGGRRAMAGLAPLLKNIARLKEAILAPNGHDCGCERPRATIPDDKGRDVEVELPRRQNVGWVLDKAQGKVLTVWECQICGDLNAYDDVPSNQVEFRTAKTNAQAQMLQLQRQGRVVTAQSFDMSKAISDIELFKVNP